MFFAGEHRPHGMVKTVPYRLSNSQFLTTVRAGGHMGPPLRSGFYLSYLPSAFCPLPSALSKRRGDPKIPSFD